MEELYNNTVLTVLSRLAMLGASLALPLAGWLLVRGVDTVDSIATKVDVIHDQMTENAGTIKMLEQGQRAQQQLLADHEARVRSLEHFQIQRGQP